MRAKLINEEALLTVLRHLQRKNILSEVVIIGGSVLYLYRAHFADSEIPPYATKDLDIMLPEAGDDTTRIDLPAILAECGFIGDASYSYSHPDIDIDILTPKSDQGRGSRTFLKGYNTFALTEVHLDLLRDHTQVVRYHGIPVTVPRIAAFTGHRFLIAPERVDGPDRDKDYAVAAALADIVLAKKALGDEFCRITESLDNSARESLYRTLFRHKPALYGVLSLFCLERFIAAEKVGRGQERKALQIAEKVIRLEGLLAHHRPIYREVLDGLETSAIPAFAKRLTEGSSLLKKS